MFILSLPTEETVAFVESNTAKVVWAVLGDLVDATVKRSRITLESQSIVWLPRCIDIEPACGLQAELGLFRILAELERETPLQVCIARMRLVSMGQAAGAGMNFDGHHDEFTFELRVGVTPLRGLS
ncbi:hypothetical protein A4W93_06755 [Piscinibacter gummiphilus]|uniref:Uncharacterized protein n=1 Tax=Piscinibacter gummiphilus TaxID=946333 RepID=A0A1W6L600_9BURK|nr:hypothetical protein A4W93_06755 [Piscinibacter gummiphilus]ATU64312.1 hypothetical protein CPZ87_06840 [Piscinibacter gummiphilus]